MENTMEFTHFMTFVEALKTTTVALQDYSSICIKDMYDRVSRKLAQRNLQPCKNNCKQQQTWCNTCMQLKGELKKYFRHSSFLTNVNWTVLNPSEWSCGYTTKRKMEIISVFVRSIPPVSIRNDLQTLISLFHSCKYFSVGERHNSRLIQSIREMRNIDYAHTECYEMTKLDLKRKLQKLKQFLQHPSFSSCPCINDAILEIARFQSSQSNVSQEMLPTSVLLNEIRANWETKNHEGLKTNIEEYLTSTVEHFEHSSSSPRSYNVSFYTHTFLCVVVVFIAIFGWYFIPQSHPIGKVCKDMEFIPPLNQDFDFGYYIYQHRHFVGRQWLLAELDDLIYNSPRGVLLVAEMGYGKSAIVSHLICQNDKSGPGYFIYEHLIAYHICDYHSRKTLKPGYFVKSLAIGLAKHNEDFYQMLMRDSKFKTYFQENECLKDPQGCVDLLILNTLTKIDLEDQTFVVIVDALDECVESEEFSILSVLETRFIKFPSNFKFLFTSRNVSSIISRLNDFTIYHQDSSKRNNIKDVEEFFSERFQNVNYSDHFKEVFSNPNIYENVQTAAKHVKGNMLYATHVADFWSRNDTYSYKETPKTLERLYQLNLERTFTADEKKFESMRKIFEILCVSLEPLSERNLLDVARIKNENEERKIMRLIRNELRHFIMEYDGKLLLTHKSFSKYLMDAGRKYENFYISKINGSRLLSIFWINVMRQKELNHKIDIIQIIEYVSNSKCEKTKSLFLKIAANVRNKISFASLLHEGAVKLNSLNGMRMIIKLTKELGYRNIDRKDMGNVTASYLASAFGNRKSLRAILDEGGNINFVRLGPRIKHKLDIVTFCKYFAQWEYSLLNIASQNGHLDVVRLLLKRKINPHHRNSLNMNSFHLAAEYGHIKILRFFLNSYDKMFLSSVNHSLYLAAKNGHVNVVNLLLYHGAVDSCLPCNGKQYWINPAKTRFQTLKNQEELEFTNYVLMDDRRYVRCESALEIAVQNGHLEVVKRLIDQKVNALYCRESGGRTPILTSVKFSRLKILKHLLMIGVPINSICSNSQKSEELDLSDFEQPDYKSNKCPLNASVYHLIAMQGGIKMLALTSNIKDKVLFMRDAVGATPLHYACCGGNYDVMKELEEMGLIYKEVTNNGSTCLHYAILCRQYEVVSKLLLRHEEKNCDYSNKCVTHYLALDPNFQLNKIRTESGALENMITSELLLQDRGGRIPLHYAVEQGNLNFLRFCISLGLNGNIWKEVFHLEDIKGKSVIDVAFQSVPNFKNFGVDIGKVEFLLRRFNDSNQRNKYFNSHEHIIYEIFLHYQKHLRIDMTNAVLFSIRKNNIFMLKMLLDNFHVAYILSINLNQTAVINTLIEMEDINHEIFPFLVFSPRLPSVCKEILKTGFLHSILEDKHRKFWILPNFRQNLDRYYDIEGKQLNACYDQDGFNPLHRAVIGGNHDGVEFLIEKGMSLYSRTLEGRDVLQLLIEKAPLFDEPYKPKFNFLHIDRKLNYSNYLILKVRYSYDKIGKIIVNKTNIIENYSKHYICFPQKQSLSFVHKVAAKKIFSVLYRIQEIHGIETMVCKNSKNITSNILLLFFSPNSNVPEERQGGYFSINVTTIPKDLDITALFMKILLNSQSFVYPKSSVLWKCRGRIWNRRNEYNILHCAGRAEEEGLFLFKRFLEIGEVRSENDLIDKLKEKFPTIHISEIKALLKPTFQALDSMLKNKRDFHYRYIYKYHYLKSKLLRLKCIVTKIFSHEESLNCLLLFARLGKLKSAAYDAFRNHSSRIMFLPLSLYNDHYPVPFTFPDPKHPEYITDTNSSLHDIYFQYSFCHNILHPAFHNAPMFNFWNAITNNHNALIVKMVKTIMKSTVREILKWKGRLTIMPRFFIFHDFSFSDNPLEFYKSLQKISD